MSDRETAKQFENDERVLQEMAQHGKGEWKFSIRYSSYASEKRELCALCGENVQRTVGENRVPLEIFLEPFPHGGAICRACAEKHAPELNMAVDLFYANGGDKKWMRRMQREENQKSR